MDGIVKAGPSTGTRRNVAVPSKHPRTRKEGMDFVDDPLSAHAEVAHARAAEQTFVDAARKLAVVGDRCGCVPGAPPPQG